MGKGHQTVDSKPLRNYMKDSGVKTQIIAKAVGIGDQAINSYIKTGYMPKYMLLCVEALNRRTKGSSVVNMKEARIEMLGDMDKLLDEILILRTKYRGD